MPNRGNIRRIEGDFGRAFVACKKWHIGGYEVSLSMDDSIGVGNGDIIRSDIRVYDEKDKDVTQSVFPELLEEENLAGVVYDDDSGENLTRAMEWCRLQKKMAVL